MSTKQLINVKAIKQSKSVPTDKQQDKVSKKNFTELLADYKVKVSKHNSEPIPLTKEQVAEKRKAIAAKAKEFNEKPKAPKAPKIATGTEEPAIVKETKAKIAAKKVAQQTTLTDLKISDLHEIIKNAVSDTKKPRAKRILTPEQKAACVERLKKAREVKAMGKPKSAPLL